MAEIFELRGNHQRTVVSAGAVSLALHGCFLAFVFGGAQILTAPSQLSPLRFSGQTFDVDAVGDIASDNSPVSPPSAPAASPSALPNHAEPNGVDASPAEPNHAHPAEASSTRPQEPSAQGASSEKKGHFTPPLDSPPPKKGADPLGMEKAALAEASSESGPKSQNVDPFDLALPGELTRTDAPSVSATYGADGSPVSSIDVFAAFLRKFPEAAKNEPTWEQLAPGSAERIVFTVTLENGERGLTLTIDETEPAPSYLHRSVIRTTHFLKHSQLAWRDGVKEGSQKLALSARVEHRKPSSRAPYSQGISAFGIHGEHRPGAAFFTYASGQHIEIELVRAP